MTSNSRGEESVNYPGAAERPLPSLAERVLIIGLDGATFDILDPMIAEGRMPRLQAFLEKGTRGILDSTIPPITPAAWTTFMTGKSPGTHGILDFERYDVRTHQLSFNSTRCLDTIHTIWDLLSQRGFRVGAVNIPMTFPPVRVNGFMISGFETPGIDVEFTYPRELKSEILSRWPQYSYKTKWRRKALGGFKLFQQNLAYINRSFHQGAQLTRYCGDRFGWDVLMVVFKLVDNLQHKTWKYLDPAMRDRFSRRKAMTSAACFNELDAAIGNLLDYAAANRAHVLMMSDHGHGVLLGKVQANLLLKDWGYLHLKEGTAQGRTRARYILDRTLRKPKGRFAGNFSIEHDLAVDFDRTEACVMHAGMYGFLYINLLGRQQTGIVTPDRYEPLRHALREKFLAAEGVGKDGRPIRLFREVYKPEDIYHCSREGRDWLPDLMLVPREELSVVRKIRGRSPLVWLPKRKIEGTHRVEGIFAAGGAGVRPGHRLRAGIADVAPTLLAMLGTRVPDDMEGHVIEDLFVSPLCIEKEAAGVVRPAISSGDSVYSEQEVDQLTNRLRDLGYLE